MQTRHCGVLVTFGRFEEAKRLVDEMKLAVESPDRDYDPPRTSVLYDGDPHYQWDVEAKKRARARLKVAEEVLEAARKELLDALDEQVPGEPT
jgi:hypothetical protein